MRQTTASRELGFSTVIAISTSVAYLLATVPILVVDPLLTTHIRYGAREYPNGWMVWPIALVILVAAFLLVYFASSNIPRLLSPIGSLIAGCVVSFPIFRPELPHRNIVFMAVVWSALIGGWILMRDYLFRLDVSSLDGVDKDAKLHYIKEHLEFSRTLLLGLVVAYIGLVLTYMTSQHAMNKDIVRLESEVFVLDAKSGVDLAFLSMFFLFGLILELAKQRRKLVDSFLSIRSQKEQTTHAR